MTSDSHMADVASSMAWPLDQALADSQAVVAERVRAAMASQHGSVADAMRYALVGGKGLRALLVLAGGGLHGVSQDKLAFPAAAVEAIHAYSLVHDDLPCMDDDDLRRGQPTVHRKWDQATAVLAGDGLQALAFELVSQGRGPAEGRIQLTRTLAEAAGIAGMVGGQALDIAAESATTPLTLADITALQARKTGALITWAACAGPRVFPGADEGALRLYGDALGLAFQITDDILDVEGDAALVGKATGKDAGKGKATFVSLLGLEAARARARSLVDEACAALDDRYGPHHLADTLREAARFVLHRRK